MTASAIGVSSTLPVHPLVAQLFTRHGCTEVTADNIDTFVAGAGHAMLVFTEDPLRVRETLDIAVIVPQLMQAFPARFRVGVLLPEAARALHTRYGFRRWPAFVVLDDGKHVGAVDGLRSWDEYMKELGELLEKAPTRPPTIGIPVVKTTGGADARGCGS
jgi:hydrogenase-1 operon protein HyaE